LTIAIAEAICNVGVSSDVLATFPIDVDGFVPTAPVTIGGQEYTFALDTGATITAFDERLRPILGRQLTKVRAATPGADIWMDLFAAPNVQLGPLLITFSNPVACLKLDAITVASPRGFDGILGMDVMKSHIVQFDFEKQIVRFLSKNSRPKRGWGIPIEMNPDVAGRPCVRASLGDTIVSFAIDTGSLTNGHISMSDFRRSGEEHFRQIGASVSKSLGGEHWSLALRTDTFNDEMPSGVKFDDTERPLGQKSGDLPTCLATGSINKLSIGYNTRRQRRRHHVDRRGNQPLLDVARHVMAQRHRSIAVPRRVLRDRQALFVLERQTSKHRQVRLTKRLESPLARLVLCRINRPATVSVIVWDPRS
jgi:hypothetical protein